MDADNPDKEKDAADAAKGSGNSDDEYFEVEKILNEIEEDGQRYYTIRWVHYGPEYDSNEPVSAIAHCTDIIAEWEKEKEARKTKAALQQQRKRSRSVRSGDESGSAKGSVSGRSRKKSKTARSSTTTSSSKRQREVEVEVEVDDDESEASKGTDDSYMNELKSKNEGTYNWEDVRRGRNKSNDLEEEDKESEDEYASLKEQERQRRKSKRKAMSPAKETKKPITATKKIPPPQPTTSSATSPLAPHFPFGSRSMNSIRPARRKPGESINTVQPDERRQRNVTNLTMSHRYNIKKRQAQEPPPDASAIAVFRPDAVLTAAARTMKSGRGYENAIGDIDTAISISQATPAGDRKPERKPDAVEKGTESPKVRSRRSSVTDAVSNALKFRDENKTRVSETSLVTRSPVSPVNIFAESIDEEVDTNALADAWLKNAPIPVHSSPRRASFSAESSRLPEQPPRHNSISAQNAPRIIPASDSNQPPGIEILPALSEDASHTWTGELLYSKERASFGPIRLFIPQSSIRIKQLPKLGSSICLMKMLSTQYLSQKWFSKTAHPTKKPECLLVEFQNKDSQTKLVDALRKTDSAGLVCEENFTLIFFFKHNERLRMLFNGDASSGPIGVALLEGVKIEALDAPSSKADELLNHRRMPYNAILLSDSIDSYIPHLRDLPYVLHSPSESLETNEMEMILAARGAIPALERQPPGLVLIHRSLLPCLNYIPDLTEYKRRNIDILVFGSYLDYEVEQGEVRSVFGSEVSKIFPNAGLISFTVDHLLENPQHIKYILAYNKSRPSWNIVLPSNMVEKFDAIEQLGKLNSEKFGDILLAIALLREQIALRTIVVEEYDLHDDFGLNSYLPFMNFLQNRDCGSIRRFLLIHPTPISGSQWASCGNGIEVYTAGEFARHFKPK